jgi:hypothetical protein
MNALTEQLKYWRAERPDEWIMDDFIRKAEKLTKRVNELESIVLPKKAKVSNAKNLEKALLAYDSWNIKDLRLFIDKYADKEVEVFTHYDDYFIVDDNNVVMVDGTFEFI